MTLIHDYIYLTNLAFVAKYPVMCGLAFLFFSAWAAVAIANKVKRR